MNLPATARTESLASDARSIDALRNAAARDPKAAVKEAAKQFEAIFMQQLMKSMRDATLSSGMLDNAATKMGTEMLDTQFAAQMTGLPGGLADLIARQLERQMGVTAAPGAAAKPAAAAGAQAVQTGEAKITPQQAAFVNSHADAARAAQAATGIPAAFMIAQAAHESGWGQRDIRNADGSSSHNLFGIKAGAGWKGAVAEVTTTEYVDGQARKVTAKFRAYASADESFRDYAKLMKDSPRYARVLADAASANGFAQGLQRAGYATDPGYADKLTRVINTTLRVQRAVA
jgi:flagellar protein FlgJ